MEHDKNLVVFVAHLVSEATIAHYMRLRSELPDESYDVVWVMTASDGASVGVPDGVDMAVLRPGDFRSLRYTPIYGTLVPGSCHFIPLCIFQRHRTYRYYWFIEYDVEFIGDWSVLMDDCDTNRVDYDFLSCHVACFGEDNKDWTWWHRRVHSPGLPQQVLRAGRGHTQWHHEVATAIYTGGNRGSRHEG